MASESLLQLSLSFSSSSSSSSSTQFASTSSSSSASSIPKSMPKTTPAMIKLGLRRPTPCLSSSIPNKRSAHTATCSKPTLATKLQMHHHQEPPLKNNIPTTPSLNSNTLQTPSSSKATTRYGVQTLATRASISNKFTNSSSTTIPNPNASGLPTPTSSLKSFKSLQQKTQRHYTPLPMSSISQGLRDAAKISQHYYQQPTSLNYKSKHQLNSLSIPLQVSCQPNISQSICKLEDDENDEAHIVEEVKSLPPLKSAEYIGSLITSLEAADLTTQKLKPNQKDEDENENENDNHNNNNNDRDNEKKITTGRTTMLRQPSRLGTLQKSLSTKPILTLSLSQPSKLKSKLTAPTCIRPLSINQDSRAVLASSSSMSLSSKVVKTNPKMSSNVNNSSSYSSLKETNNKLGSLTHLFGPQMLPNLSKKQSLGFATNKAILPSISSIGTSGNKLSFDNKKLNSRICSPWLSTPGLEAAHKLPKNKLKEENNQKSITDELNSMVSMLSAENILDDSQAALDKINKQRLEDTPTPTNDALLLLSDYDRSNILNSQTSTRLTQNATCILSSIINETHSDNSSDNYSECAYDSSQSCTNLGSKKELNIDHSCNDATTTTSDIEIETETETETDDDTYANCSEINSLASNTNNQTTVQNSSTLINQKIASLLPRRTVPIKRRIVKSQSLRLEDLDVFMQRAAATRNIATQPDTSKSPDCMSISKPANLSISTYDPTSQQNPLPSSRQALSLAKPSERQMPPLMSFPSTLLRPDSRLMFDPTNSEFSPIDDCTISSKQGMKFSSVSSFTTNKNTNRRSSSSFRTSKLTSSNFTDNTNLSHASDLDESSILKLKNLRGSLESLKVLCRPASDQSCSQQLMRHKFDEQTNYSELISLPNVLVPENNKEHSSFCASSLVAPKIASSSSFISKSLPRATSSNLKFATVARHPKMRTTSSSSTSSTSLQQQQPQQTPSSIGTSMSSSSFNDSSSNTTSDATVRNSTNLFGSTYDNVSQSSLSQLSTNKQTEPMKQNTISLDKANKRLSSSSSSLGSKLRFMSSSISMPWTPSNSNSRLSSSKQQNTYKPSKDERYNTKQTSNLPLKTSTTTTSVPSKLPTIMSSTKLAQNSPKPRLFEKVISIM